MSFLLSFQKQQNMIKINAKREKFHEKTKNLAKHLVDNPLGECMTLERETILAATRVGLRAGGFTSCTSRN